MSSIIITATKPSSSSIVGVGLRNADGGGVYVNSIRENSIFVNTMLQIGMIIERINDIDCTSLTSMEAADVLRGIRREVSIVARYTPMALTFQPQQEAVSSVTVTAIKPTRETRVGVGLIDKYGGGVQIKSLKPYGVFASALLRPGMTVDSVNGIDCTRLTGAEVVHILRQAVGEITLMATTGNAVTSVTTASPVALTEARPGVIQAVAIPEDHPQPSAPPA